MAQLHEKANDCSTIDSGCTKSTVDREDFKDLHMSAWPVEYFTVHKDVNYAMPGFSACTANNESTYFAILFMRLRGFDSDHNAA